MLKGYIKYMRGGFIPNNLGLGKAGEYRVVSELLLRGHEPTLSILDDGVDIYCSDCATAIQVKTSLNPLKQVYSNSYHFNIRTWHRGRRTHPHKADVFVCWGVSTDEFWVIPSTAVSADVNINITSPYSAKYHKYKDAWHLIGVPVKEEGDSAIYLSESETPLVKEEGGTTKVE